MKQQQAILFSLIGISENHEPSLNNFNSKPNSSDYHTSSIGLEFEFLWLLDSKTPQKSN